MSKLSRRPPVFLYEIYLQSWNPHESRLPVSRNEIYGGANDMQIAWAFARQILRMAPDTEKQHHRVQVWRRRQRGISEKMIFEQTRAEMDARSVKPESDANELVTSMTTGTMGATP